MPSTPAGDPEEEVEHGHAKEEDSGQAHLLSPRRSFLFGLVRRLRANRKQQNENSANQGDSNVDVAHERTRLVWFQPVQTSNLGEQSIQYPASPHMRL